MVKENIDPSARLLVASVAARGVNLTGKNVKTDLVEAAEMKKLSEEDKERSERIQIRLGKDVLVFTRF